LLDFQLGRRERARVLPTRGGSTRRGKMDDEDEDDFDGWEDGMETGVWF
jgi:hypothetical protein